MKRSITLASMIAIAAAAYVPLTSVAQTSYVVINSAPPAPRFESVPPARNGYVWAPGYWNWDGARHTWVSGHWERARQGYRYQSSEWTRDDRGYRLRQGGWQQVARASYDDVRIAPPAPRHERIPRARRGHVWEPGHWEWRGNRYEWRSGQWLAQRPDHVYSQGTWIERNGRWYFEPSRWTPRGRDRDRDGIPDRMERRDRDRDGVPDAYDRDRDNDGVSNRRDADRDGDGVRNDRDARPDNPRRY